MRHARNQSVIIEHTNNTVADDEPDFYEAIVFDKHGEERSPWLLCGQSIPRSQIVFIVQLFVLLLINTYCMIKISLGEISCEENTIYFMIISSSLTYILPSPVTTAINESGQRPKITLSNNHLPSEPSDNLVLDDGFVRAA